MTAVQGRGGLAAAVSLPDVTMRYAVAQDGIPVRRLVFDILCEYGVPADPDGSDADVMEFGAPRDARTVHLVVSAGDEVVGCAIIRPTAAADEAKLSKLFLRERFRGKGLGRHLLTRAEAEASARGYDSIRLCTRALYVEAVRLYERSGWVRGPDQPPPGPDRLYVRRLGPGRPLEHRRTGGTEPSSADGRGSGVAAGADRKAPIA